MTTTIELPEQQPKRRARGLLLGGGLAAVALLAGGAVWAYATFWAQGPQPSEILPDDTLGYVSIDIDPSGQQKIAAIEFFRKFPAFKDEVDLDTDDDVRERIFDLIQQEEDTCEGLDYQDDIEPWLGDRAALAAVARGEDDPAPVIVVQVKDDAKAEDGLEKLAECSGEDIGGFAFSGDWVVLAETEDIAKDVVTDAEESNLADDDDYRKWTEAAGDPGIVTVYLAPEAGGAILDFIDDVAGLGAGFEDELGADLLEGELPDDVTKAFEDFPGMAGTIRFDNGDVELEFAAGEVDGSIATFLNSEAGDDVVDSLPDTTVAALGIGFRNGWAEALLDQVGPIIEEEAGMSVDEGLDELEAETGLVLPEDLETLTGDSLAIAVDESISLDEFENEDPSLLSAGIKIKGDADAIEEVLDKLREAFGLTEEMLLSKTEGDTVVIGTNEDYVDKLAEGGDLGSDDLFRDVVPQAPKSSQVLFLDFDSGNWLVELVEDLGEGEDVIENIEPLSALGFSTWSDDDGTHTLFKITTD